MTTRSPLTQSLNNQQSTVAVLGLGYVGLPLAVACAEAGFSTIGIDINQNRVQSLRDGIAGLPDLPNERLRSELQAGRLRVEHEMDALAEVDAVLICVPTPLNKTKEPDLSYVVNALHSVREHLHSPMLVVLESTTYPGFTREVALPLLEESGLSCGTDFCLAFSPERTDPGNQTFQVGNTPKIVGGITETCTDATRALYGQLIDTVHVVSSTDTAEMVKLLENTFRAVNIGLVNEVALMCRHLNIDTWEVIEAAKTKPFGFMPFYPGPGLGGHCIPIDPLYLSWKLRSYNYTARFIELAQTINASMPQFVVNMVGDGLNSQKKPLSGAKITILGVSYKPNVSDTRESPALEIMGLLARSGATVTYSDPLVESLQVDGHQYSHVGLDTAIDQCDAVVIATHHSDTNWASVVEKAPLIIDTRNATAHLPLTEAQRAKVWRL